MGSQFPRRSPGQTKNEQLKIPSSVGSRKETEWDLRRAIQHTVGSTKVCSLRSHAPGALTAEEPED
uniref:Uncharacterized protein n=1 Tax=Cercocebus atys TaxID=9531 RepID=A0A2K5L7L0_CERAT